MNGHRQRTRAIQVIGRYTINKLAIGLTRLGIPVPGLWSPSTNLVLDVRGRKSGKQRLTPMVYVREHETSLLAVAERGIRENWVRNLLASDQAVVWIGRRRFPVRGHLRGDIDPEEVVGRMNPINSLLVRGLSADPKVIEFEILSND